MKKLASKSLRSTQAKLERDAARGQKKLPAITAAEFDRRFDAGEELEEYMAAPITAAEMEKHVEMSKTPGRLEAYLAKNTADCPATTRTHRRKL